MPEALEQARWVGPMLVRVTLKVISRDKDKSKTVKEISIDR
jgi:hypothetical protein